MKKHHCICILSLALLFWTAAAAPTARAQDEPGIELRTVAEVEVEVAKDDGFIEIRRAPAGKVVPGDEVIYTMHYRNAGSEPADDVVITNPLPEHMLLLRTDVLEGGLNLIFSVNGGQEFDALARLSVIGEDGRQRPATADPASPQSVVPRLSAAST